MHQLKSVVNPLNYIIFLITKTQSIQNPDINFYDAMIYQMKYCLIRGSEIAIESAMINEKLISAKSAQ